MESKPLSSLFNIIEITRPHPPTYTFHNPPFTSEVENPLKLHAAKGSLSNPSFSTHLALYNFLFQLNHPRQKPSPIQSCWCTSTKPSQGFSHGVGTEGKLIDLENEGGLESAAIECNLIDEVERGSIEHTTLAKGKRSSTEDNTHRKRAPQRRSLPQFNILL